MTAFGPTSTFAVSSIGAGDEPIEFFAADTLAAAIAEAAPPGMLWMNELTDQITILLVDLTAPILANRDLADNLAIVAAIDSAIATADVVKAGLDDLLVASALDRLELIEHFFSPAWNRGIVVGADQRAAGPHHRHKTQIVGRDRHVIIVGADDRTGKGSGQ